MSTPSQRLSATQAASLAVKIVAAASIMATAEVGTDGCYNVPILEGNRMRAILESAAQLPQPPGVAPGKELPPGELVAYWMMVGPGQDEAKPETAPTPVELYRTTMKTMGVRLDRSETNNLGQYALSFDANDHCVDAWFNADDKFLRFNVMPQRKTGDDPATEEG
jgi:hypothetical protein